MFSAFLNPFTIAVGSALVLTPIIIHLINRIRFRRVKWAAMEFLLKAQKKMRRKKILEQLLLLFLRCLLVFLVGVLFARFIGCKPGEGKESRPTTHVVILDDTPSMADGARREEGGKGTVLDEGKRLIHEKLMPAAGQAQSAQTFHLIRVSDPDNPFPKGTKPGKDEKTGQDVDVKRSEDEIRDAARVNSDNISLMDVHLRGIQPSTVRKSLVESLRKAKELFAQRSGGNTAQVLHIISDLRAGDWATDGPAITEAIKEFKENGVTVHLVDVASPARKPDRKSPPFSDNIGIVEFKPRNRVVSVNQMVELEVRVKNFGGTDLKQVRVDFFLNGQPDQPFQTISIETLPANQERTQTVQGVLPELEATAFDDLKMQTNDKRIAMGKPEITAEEERELKALMRFRLITAALSTPEPGGLVIDNSRHTVIEVRDALKVLVVDGRGLEGGVNLREKPEGDSYFLRTLFMQTKAEELGRMSLVDGTFGPPDVTRKNVEVLDTCDLRPYSAVYLMNVPTLNSDAVKNLEKFVSEGGGVGVFLGPNVKPDDYTEKFYRGGTGFFPVPLQKEPSKELTPEQKFARELAFGKRVLLREPGNRYHPALKRIYLDDRGDLLKDDGVERFFLFANIDTHWPVTRRGAWREDKLVRELYCLPNEASIASFEQRADTLVAEVKKRYGEPKFAEARKYLDPLLETIRKTPKSDQPLSMLARFLDQLLCDQINDGHESEPVLRDFWNQPEMAETKQQAMLVRDEAKFGDPLYVVKQFGRGRVAVMTTDCGGTHTGKKQWTDWPSGKGSPGWVVVAAEMHKYLTGGGDDANRSVGDRFTGEFDLARYEPVVSVSLLTADATKPGADRKLSVERRPLGKVTMLPQKNPPEALPDAPPRPFLLTYDAAHTPGAYLFTLKRTKQAAAPGATPDPLGDFDFVGVPFNVDALNEGDLRRVNTDDLAAQTSKAPLHNTEDLGWIDDLKQKPTDLSSGRWLYLFILLVLLAEQAWAVRVSYHSKPEDLELHAPSAAAAFAHHATPTPASSGEPAPAGEPTSAG